MYLIDAWLSSCGSPSECAQKLIDLIISGKLVDEFTRSAESRNCIIGCFLKVIGALLSRAGDGVHPEHEDVDDGEAVIVADDLFLHKLPSLADAIGVPCPVGGPLTDVLVQVITSALLAKLKELLDEWLSE